MIITNEFRLMHYYLEQNKAKCKFIKLKIKTCHEDYFIDNW